MYKTNTKTEATSFAIRKLKDGQQYGEKSTNDIFVDCVE